MTRHHLLLMLAIVAEVIATTALARSASFTRLWPSVVAVGGYAIAFWLLSITMRVMPTGIVYAIWSGMGIVLITAIAWVWYRETLDLPAVLGLGLIVAGVIVINVFSKTVAH
jgi:small multidrug resistance pump